MSNIRLEILEGSYLEHFKIAKDFALYLPIDHPKRIKIEKHLNEIVFEIQELKTKLKNK